MVRVSVWFGDVGMSVRLVGSKKSQGTYDMMPQHSLIHWIMGNSRSLDLDIFFLTGVGYLEDHHIW